MGNNKSKNKEKNKEKKEEKEKKEKKEKYKSTSEGEDNNLCVKFPNSIQDLISKSDLKMKEKYDSVYNIDNIDLFSNPEKIQFSIDLTNDSYSPYNWLDNTFTVFKCKNDALLYLIYTNRTCSIIGINLIDNKKIIEIKNAHEKEITNFRYHYDKINKNDLIMSIAASKNNIKIWNVKNWECIIDIDKINNTGCLVSACFLIDKDENFIVSSNDKLGVCDSIKIFNFKGNKIKEINNSNNLTCFIDTYYDNKLDKNYIITGNYKFSQSYDYNKNDIYKKYCDNDINSHCSLIIYNKEDKIQLIDSCRDGNIRIWDFHLAILLKKINIGGYLIGICLWNQDYLFISGSERNIILVELNKGKIINNLIASNKYIVCVKKIIHPKYGECLISQGDNIEQIKLWMKKK